MSHGIITQNISDLLFLDCGLTKLLTFNLCFREMAASVEIGAAFDLRHGRHLQDESV
jgi:hypothetical protein